MYLCLLCATFVLPRLIKFFHNMWLTHFLHYWALSLLAGWSIWCLQILGMDGLWSSRRAQDEEGGWGSDHWRVLASTLVRGLIGFVQWMHQIISVRTPSQIQNTLSQIQTETEAEKVMENIQIACFYSSDPTTDLEPRSYASIETLPTQRPGNLLNSVAKNTK